MPSFPLQAFEALNGVRNMSRQHLFGSEQHVRAANRTACLLLLEDAHRAYDGALPPPPRPPRPPRRARRRLESRIGGSKGIRSHIQKH